MYPADDGTCRRCPPHCDICSDDRTCFKCTFLYLMLNGACRASCPMEYYEDMEEGRCGQCHPTCGSCSGPLEDDCETCSSFSPKLYKGSCLKDCPTGTYYEIAAMECQECHQTCKSCIGPDPNQCSQCEKGLVLDPNTLLCGVTGYYKKGSHCEKCDESCELCTGPGPESCRRCPLPLLELDGTKLCVERCPHRFYQFNEICKQCHVSCQTCTDSSPQSCETCDRGSTLKDKVCYPRCEEGRYFSEEEICESCDSSCRHCTGPRPDQCLLCHNDFALHAVENRCTRCCQAAANHTNCCVCDSGSALCVEAPQPRFEEATERDVIVSSKALKHSSAALPVALLLAAGLGLAVLALAKAHAKRRLCWNQSYERLSGSGSINMPHGVPEPDSGDEVDVVYTTKGGSVYRRYSFIHEQEADPSRDENTCLSQS
uniref:Uncharacterized protein n=1 Tax=Nothobranchius kuhntae TaxID=321403 RepID=A0A1A8IX25_NOTKU